MNRGIEDYKKVANEKKQCVTVFMLTHNRAKYLELAINSMLVQTYTNFSLVILDNFSIDDTESMVSKIRDERVFYEKKRLLPEHFPLKYAEEVCVAPFFIVLHDDDILESNYLETVVDLMESSDYAAISVRSIRIDEDGNLINCADNNKTGTKIFKQDEYFNSFFDNNFDSMVFPSVIYRKEFYKNKDFINGNPKAGPCSDQLFWFETTRYGGEICIYDKKLIRYRSHSGQDSKIHKGQMDLVFLSFLINDEYYSYKILLNGKALYRLIWNAFVDIYIRFAKNELSDKDMQDVFEYDCVRYMQQKFVGKCITAIMKIMLVLSFINKRIIRMIIKCRKKKLMKVK